MIGIIKSIKTSAISFLCSCATFTPVATQASAFRRKAQRATQSAGLYGWG